MEVAGHHFFYTQELYQVAKWHVAQHNLLKSLAKDEYPQMVNNCGLVFLWICAAWVSIQSLNNAGGCSSAYLYLKQEKQHVSDFSCCVCLPYLFHVDM